MSKIFLSKLNEQPNNVHKISKYLLKKEKSAKKYLKKKLFNNVLKKKINCINYILIGDFITHKKVKKKLIQFQKLQQKHFCSKLPGKTVGEAVFKNILVSDNMNIRHLNYFVIHVFVTQNPQKTSSFHLNKTTKKPPQSILNFMQKF